MPRHDARHPEQTGRPPIFPRRDAGEPRLSWAAAVERQRAAVFNAFSDPHLTTTRQALYLKALPVSTYRRISEFEDYAERLGYPELR